MIDIHRCFRNVSFSFFFLLLKEYRILFFNTTLPCFTDADGQTCVKFGVLFNDDRCANIFEALVGTLRAAKRKKIIAFEGELLLQGVHDNVDITLLQE